MLPKFCHLNINPFEIRLVSYFDSTLNLFLHFVPKSGVFKELKRIEPDYSFSKRDRLEHRAFLIVGMRNIEPRVTPVLENW